ncbi:MAG: EAL domain-containing protein [Gammaproteobacteria bacterium]|nr:EAL domain-containing protein [Gammaproteobacteria bacterium]
MTADVHSLSTIRNIGKVKGLLHSLVPRAQCFCFYADDRSCIWSSDGAEDYEIDSFVTGLPPDIFVAEEDGTEFLRRTLKSGRTLLVLPVTDDADQEIGLLVVVFSKNAGKSSWFNPSMLYGILAPALDIIAETLRLNQQLANKHLATREIEEELKLVYAVDEKIHGTSRSHAGLAQLVGQSGRFLNICYSVLLIPSKRIRVSATHSSWKGVNRKVLDRYLIEQILPAVEGKRVPIIFEMPADRGESGAVDGGYQTLVSPLADINGNVQGVLAQLGRVNDEPFNNSHRRFMSHIVRKVEYVIEQSFDFMTGLMNRSGFEAQLQESWRTLEGPRDSHQIIYLDLDNLQLVNDTFGRDAGDAVIMRFARMLEEDLPKSAVVSRLTGDDFCILLTHAEDNVAMEHALTIRERGEALRYLQGDKSLQVTISIGISAFSHASGDETKALTSARMACEAAKDHGRDRIEVYNLSNESLIQRRDDMQLVTDIQRALDSDGLELMAQQIASLGLKRDRPRFEILLRMKDGDGELVSTTAFFSAAERYQIMPQIDRWVVSATIARLNEYADDINALDVLFSMNLSGQSLGDDEILEFIEDEIKASGIAARSLGFEVTESAAVSNLTKAQAFIDALHDRGCRIALDDFGAGLSSFAYLKNFRVDTLKIDGSFIRDITDNRISESMVAAITQVAKVMKLDTVAEYVEHEKTRKLITELGVDFAQGHAIGKPQPLAEVLESLGDVAESTA